jgi:two-component system chemotaxis response regulator CheY
MKLNALVIDDSKIMRKMVIQALQGSGMAEFTFVEAEDGAEALAKFSPGSTDIVFADWNMPNMSGIEFVDKVRAMKRTAHIPIIMVTSEKTMGKMEQALDKSGANAYICKPFTAEDLQRKLARLIEELEQRRAAEKPAGFFSRLVGA